MSKAFDIVVSINKCRWRWMIHHDLLTCHPIDHAISACIVPRAYTPRNTATRRPILPHAVALPRRVSYNSCIAKYAAFAPHHPPKCPIVGKSYCASSIRLVRHPWQNVASARHPQRKPLRFDSSDASNRQNHANTTILSKIKKEAKQQG